MSKRGRPPHPDILTPREWEVLALLRAGLTNEGIAQRLDVSTATAKYHVSEILSKLGVDSREEAAAWQREPEGAWRRLLQAGLVLKAAAAAVVVVVLAAGLGVLVWSALGSDGDDEAITPSSTGPSLLTEARVADLPVSLFDFAAQMDNAMIARDTGFFTQHTLFRDYYECGGSRSGMTSGGDRSVNFPAPGPLCALASPGTGDLAIAIGALQSEGDVFDAPSYQRFIQDFLTNVGAAIPDKLGGPDPRLAALGDTDPVIEEQRPDEDTYALIASAVGGPAVDRSGNVVIGGMDGRRIALAFFVTHLPDGWRITGLSRMGPYALDPQGQDAITLGMDKLFSPWVRWDSGAVGYCTGSVTGRLVLDHGDHGPVAGEWLQIDRLTGDALVVQTAADGVFRLDSVPVGSNLIAASDATFPFSIGHCGQVLDLGDVPYALNHPTVLPLGSQFQGPVTCADAPGGTYTTVTIAVNPGVPSPRCARVAPMQRLQFVNNTADTITLQLGSYNETIAPGESKVLDKGAGEYLPPGVSLARISVYGGGGPEIWLGGGPAAATP
jgi:DNA-binding CsgD family transcriptional regulator